MITIPNKTIIKFKDLDPHRYVESEGIIICNVGETIHTHFEAVINKDGKDITRTYSVCGVIIKIDNYIQECRSRFAQTKYITVELDEDSKQTIKYNEKLVKESKI